MVRSTNPFVERMAFFWHRHWANSRESVSPPQLLLQQNGLFRRYADFGANGGASFRDLAYELTVDPAMLRYLTGEYNVKGAPNENYARELMELFGLGVMDAERQAELQRERRAPAREGAVRAGRSTTADPDNAKSYFTPDRWYNGPKIVFGKFGNYKQNEAVDLVLAHPAHAPLHRREALARVHRPAAGRRRRSSRCVSTYTGSGLKLKPLLEKILGDKALFASLGEPTMVKPPIVFVVEHDARARRRASPTPRPPTTSTRWARSPTSRRRWRAGRAASRG